MNYKENIRSEIGWLVLFFRQTQRISYEKKLNCGIYGKKLQELLSETHEAKCDWEPCQAEVRPIPYEEEYKFVL